MPTIYLIGDSTVEDGTEPFHGWGWAFGSFAAVPVVNRALGGRSSQSYWNEGLFTPVRAALCPGDALLIQFGHNDEKDDPDRHTDPENSYPDMLSRFCDAAIDAGALPVLVTPVCRRYFLHDGNLLYTHGEYPAAIRALAARRDLPLCDLQRASRALYRTLGPAETAKLFVRLAPGEYPAYPEGHDDYSHFNDAGARRVAELAAEEMARDPRCRAYIRITEGRTQ
ncbi:MAG: rhamnogalacturonan acetylesterase [Eubacteriales bacterium]|nr:rhamnogalacturonan acetylesterase [Eubacteriales bacterium]